MEFEHESEEFTNIIFKVVRQCNKTQFDTYTRTDVPVFLDVFTELREFLFKYFETELAPAASAESFRLGYIAVANRRITISSNTQLAEAYVLEKKGWITLWADVEKPKAARAGTKRTYSRTLALNVEEDEGRFYLIRCIA